MNLEVKFDYLSATFPLFVQGDDSERKVQEDVLIMVAKFLNVENYEMHRDDYTTNRFKYQYTLADNIILRLAGAVNNSGYKTCQLEMKGQGCREFEKRNKDKKWSDLFYFITELNGVFKRIDIAIDDFSGEAITNEYLYNKVLNKFYTSTFISKPTPMGTLENGLTIQFGSNNSPVQLSIYDKKRQLLKSKQIIEEDYWVRYEIRFRRDKAQAIAEKLLVEYDDEENYTGFNLLQLTQEQLYRVLDIKEDNNYSVEDQKKVDTDSSWLEFLNNVEKGTLKSRDKVYADYEKHYEYAAPKGMFILLIKYLILKKDKNLFITEVFREMYKHSELKKEKFYKLNKYLIELGQPVLTDDELEQLQIEFFNEVQEREMPF